MLDLKSKVCSYFFKLENHYQMSELEAAEDVIRSRFLLKGRLRKSVALPELVIGHFH